MTANAGLLGTDITLNYAYLGKTSTDIISVNSGVEVQCNGLGLGNAYICGILTAPNQTIDFGDDTITYNYVSTGKPEAFLPGNPNGFDFLNLAGNIHDVILTTTIEGLDASRLSFTANSIHLYMGGLDLDCEDTFTLRMVTNPEPSAAMLGGLSVLLLGIPHAIRKRRRK